MPVTLNIGTHQYQRLQILAQELGPIQWEIHNHLAGYQSTQTFLNIANYEMMTNI